MTGSRKVTFPAPHLNTVSKQTNTTCNTFSAPVQTGFGAHPASYKMVSFPRVKRLGRGLNHPLPSSLQVKEKVAVNLYSHCAPSWPALGQTLHSSFLLPVAQRTKTQEHRLWAKWNSSERHVACRHVERLEGRLVCLLTKTPCILLKQQM